MDNQRHILNFILGCEEDFLRLPTFLEIREQFPALAETQLVSRLRGLQKEGLLTLAKNGRRILRTEPHMRVLPPIPVQGCIAAGFAAGAETASLRGSITVDLSGIGIALGKGAFALQVRGDSMVDAGIQTGDLVLLEPGHPVDGEIVAASIKGQMILKRFVVIKKVPYLVAENAAQPELRPATDEPIHGVLRALLRISPTARAWEQPRQPKIRYSTAPQLRKLAVAPRRSRVKAAARTEV